MREAIRRLQLKEEEEKRIAEMAIMEIERVSHSRRSHLNPEVPGIEDRPKLVKRMKEQSKIIDMRKRRKVPGLPLPPPQPPTVKVNKPAHRSYMG